MSSLNQLSALVKLHKSLEDDVAKLERKIKKKKEEIEYLERFEIPDRLFDAEVSTFVTDDGWGIKLEDVWSASISEKRRPTVIEFLKKRELDSIITNNFTIIFEKGTKEEVEEFQKYVYAHEALRSRSGLKETVNTATFKSVIKEYQHAMIEAEEGGELTQEQLKDLGVYTFERAKIIDTTT